MQSCWAGRAGERPTFGALKMALQDAYGAEVAAQALDAHRRVHSNDDEGLCVLCLESRADFALLPCGHMCVCERDAAVVCGQGTCPLCRAPVSGCNRICPG
jgi:hypothetical protein